ncbi:hypothetical protein EGT74_10680 [Chitinophaga lutea]|uniref:Uncharacterized protein n=1 Tax=Chitinophaga lutea TaxID=2488634 RepID=A0A3N4Q3Z3_9BACT|nr:hypothetical protein EGT74_10680 [Chitinophaga lutea]
MKKGPGENPRPNNTLQFYSLQLFGPQLIQNYISGVRIGVKNLLLIGNQGATTSKKEAPAKNCQGFTI